MRLRLLTLALPALFGLPTGCPAAYVTGVYWVEDGIYYLDLTLHNNEPDDEWDVFDLSVVRGGFEAQAPPFWYVRERETSYVAWHAEDDHWLPPGEELSGFTFQTCDLDDWYSYKIYASNQYTWTGWFQPELIPWPPLAAPAALAILGLWATRRLRKR